MLSQVYYLIRSKLDGSYLVAHPTKSGSDPEESRSQATGFLLMFREHYDALSYLNTHGSGMADRFAVESVPATQIEHLLDRWGFAGVGLVQDALLPKVEFLARQME